jgi:eukaryotic-like serine/threonine-protein kinase
VNKMPEEQILLSKRYRLEERLGSGGMAVVYRAHDLMLERTVAIKLLRKDFSSTEEFRDRFRLEAKAAANLSHPNIVTIHDFGLDGDQVFIVMEYVPGSDLKTMLKQRGRLGIAEAIDLIAQACAGIGYAHRAGLVHCDVKPQNMLVTPEGRLKVTDFGIARALVTISPDEQTDIVWGSPQYFSPEQAAGGAPSPASDVYSLGVVLYEMLAGSLPFNANTPEELARLHREAQPPSPRKYNPAISIPLEQIVLKVLSKEPSARYRTADQLGSVLANLEKQSSVRPAAQSVQPVKPPPAQPAKQPSAPAVQAVRPARPMPQPPAKAHPTPPYSQPEPLPQIIVKPVHTRTELDWLTWGLALLALIALGGLIPFWLWVYYMLNPPL